MPTQSVSRHGVRDGIYLVVRSAALEPRAGTLRPARLRCGIREELAAGNERRGASQAGNSARVASRGPRLRRLLRCHPAG